MTLLGEIAPALCWPGLLHRVAGGEAGRPVKRMEAIYLAARDVAGSEAADCGSDDGSDALRRRASQLRASNLATRSARASRRRLVSTSKAVGFWFCLDMRFLFAKGDCLAGGDI